MEIHIVPKERNPKLDFHEPGIRMELVYNINDELVSHYTGPISPLFNYVELEILIEFLERMLRHDMTKNKSYHNVEGFYFHFMNMRSVSSQLYDKYIRDVYNISLREICQILPPIPSDDDGSGNLVHPVLMYYLIYYLDANGEKFNVEITKPSERITFEQYDF